MNDAPRPRLRWWRRIGPRLCLTVILAVVCMEIITIPLWAWIASVHEFDWVDPWPASWSLADAVIEISVFLLVGVSVGGVLGLVASRVVLRRVRTMAAIAERTPSDGVAGSTELPGPYAEDGDDEITQLARALNRSRNRAGELLERLRERDALRLEWVAQVSHDLRTPLTALTTSLEEVQSRIARDEVDGDELAGQLGVAIEDAERVSSLAGDLLDVARLETEAQPRREEVLPGEVVDATVRLLAPIARRRDLVLQGECAPELPTLLADGRLVCRALENLVSNSLQHARARVTVVASPTPTGARFAVIDDGPGFAEVDGEVSFRTALELRSRPDSAGIGLLVTQRVAGAHGGSVGACNRSEGGAEVWFEVGPVAAGDP